MSQVKVFFKNSSWYLFGSGIQGLSPFLLTPILTRLISETEFSSYVLFISLGTILSFLFSAGIPAALTRNLILDKKNSNSDIISVDLVKKSLLFLSAFLLIVTFFAVDTLFLLISAVSLSLSLAVVQIDMSIYRARQIPGKFVFNSIFSTAIPSLIMTIGIYFNLLFGNFIFFYALIVFLFTAISNFYLIFKKTNSKNLKGLFLLGWPTIPHGLGMSMVQYGDKVIVSILLGLTAAGQIQIASLIGSAPVLLLSSLNNAWITPVLEKFNSGLKTGETFLNRTTNLVSFFVSTISLIIAIFSIQIINLFAPPTYNTATLSEVASLMTSASILYAIYLRNIYILAYKGKFQSLSWITPLSIGIQFLSLYIFITSFGLIGVSLTFTLVNSSQAFITQLVVSKLAPELKLTYKPIFIFLITFGIIYLITYYF